MGFTDFGFWLALLPVVALFHALPGRWRPAWLLAASLAYFTIESGAYVLLLLASVGWVWAAGHRIARAETDRARLIWLWAGLVPAAGVLVLFKLGDAMPGIAAPLGISYYTFRLIAYLVEVYWDERQLAPGWLDFAAYVSFGPHMVSGPIQRPGDFLPQLAALRHRLDPARIEGGLQMLLNGLMLKLIIGDRLAPLVNMVDGAPAAYARPAVWLAAVAHLPYLYADFAGYTLIALGLGALFGIAGPPNFNAPFAATNVAEYWRRWHMSLTGWLTDYVFMPLRMATRHWGRAGLVLSIFVNMVLVGLWHRISGTYLVFGLVQGAYVAVYTLWLAPRGGPARGTGQPLVALAKAVCVFVLMDAALIVWFAPALPSAATEARMVLGLLPPGPRLFEELPEGADIKAACIALVLAIYIGAGAPGMAAIRARLGRHVPGWAWVALKLLLISLLGQDNGGAFIYGHF